MPSNIKRMCLALVLVAAMLLSSACQPKAPQENPAVSKALAWLRTQQQADGSFNAGFGHPAGVTCDVALAIAAAGGDPATWRAAEGQPSIMDYLAASANEYTVDVASTAKLIVTLVAAGRDPRQWNGQDLLARLKSFAQSEGVYDSSGAGQAWAVLALAAAGEKQPAAVNALKAQQLESGAWLSAFGPDNDTTSFALQALIAGGEPKNSAAIQKALTFFESQQNDDGGFPAIKPSDWGTDTNANSTASVIMALAAVGEKPTAKRWSKAGGDPLKALSALQAADGRIEFQPGVGNPLLSTAQAIPALLGKTLPLRAKR